MNLQHAAEEPKNNYLSPVSEEQETVEMLLDATATEAPPLAMPQRARRALGLLKKRNPVRQVAEAILQGEPLQEGQFAALLHCLKSASANRWNERLLASWLLGRLPLADYQAREAIIALGDAVEKSHKRDRFRAWGRFCWRSGAYFLLGALIVTSMDWIIRNLAPFLEPLWDGLGAGLRWVFEPYTKIWDKIMTTLVGNGTQIPPLMQPILFISMCILVPAPVSLPISAALDRKRQNRVRSEAALSLTQLGGVEALPYLLATIGSARGELYQELLDGVATLLPRLTSEDYGRLRSDVVPNLCYLLQNYTGDFLLAILEALGKVGDGRAISAVTRLSEDAESPAHIRDAANRILPLLLERRERENDSQNLLRASKEPVSERELLRPAQPVEETQPETLLRPSDAP